jgi:glycosyltransferase involved in cell wall biosynthesis
MTPLISGVRGDVINELQLAKALSKFGNIYLIGFRKLTDKCYVSKDLTKVFALPIVEGLITPLSFIISLFASLFSYVLITAHVLDIIYCRGSALAFGFLMFNKTASRTIVKIVGIPEDETQNIVLKKILHIIYGISDKLCIAKAARIAVPSLRFLKFLSLERKALPKYDPLIIPPGIDLTLIKKVKSIMSFVQQYQFRIGFIGSLSWHQGVDLLVRAVALVKKVYPEVELYIVGDGPEKSKIERLCNQYKLNYVITGYVPHEQALKLLSTFSLLVMPRRRTRTTDSNVPIKVIEAWALDIPVLTTRCKVFEENYKDGEDLILCDNRPEDIAKKILEVFNKKELKVKLAAKGPHLAKEFSYETSAKKIIRLIY